MNANTMVIFRVLLPVLLKLFACDMAAGYGAVPTGMKTARIEAAKRMSEIDCLFSEISNKIARL